MLNYEKQLNRKKAEATAWRWFSLWIRIKDADCFGIVKCYTCTTRKHYKSMEAGHYKPQGHYKGIKFEERNTHPQCNSCNQHKSGRLDVYAVKMIEDYGTGIFDELMLLNRVASRKLGSDFREMADKYRLLCKEKLKHMEIMECAE